MGFGSGAFGVASRREQISQGDFVLLLVLGVAAADADGYDVILPHIEVDVAFDE